LRQLKFRVWNKVARKMHNPQAISFDIQSRNPFAVSVPGKSWDPVGKYELLQWTGLTDAQGIDVYEADLIFIQSEVYCVQWNEALASFELKSWRGSSQRDMSTVSTGKVIGNTFQTEN